MDFSQPYAYRLLSGWGSGLELVLFSTPARPLCEAIGDDIVMEYVMEYFLIIAHSILSAEKEFIASNRIL